MRLKKDSSEQKLRGAYYTPLQLANAMVNLCASDDIHTVLEPSCGDGVFLDSLRQLNLIEQIGTIDAVEIESDEAEKVQRNYRNYQNVHVLNEDFFEFYSRMVDAQTQYDLILGNPPYIRYQYLTETQRELQSNILTSHGMKANNFMFSTEESLLSYTYMGELCEKLMAPSVNGEKGVKIIDFSEVPSDILPLIVSLIARVIFSVQQWTPVNTRHPIAVFCDEAHLYIPANTEKSIDDASLVTFERISKEGRKYGVGLVVISQRPSEVNRTVLSQSNNFIAMRLTNVDDQSVVKRLLPDSLGDYAEMLPILDVGEALVVGDASLLPSRIRVTAPALKPRSATIDFWDEWSKETTAVDLNNAIEALRKQSR